MPYALESNCSICYIWKVKLKWNEWVLAKLWRPEFAVQRLHNNIAQNIFHVSNLSFNISHKTLFYGLGMGRILSWIGNLLWKKFHSFDSGISALKYSWFILEMQKANCLIVSFIVLNVSMNIHTMFFFSKNTECLTNIRISIFSLKVHTKI